MIWTLLLLCFEFFKTGLFAIGGGLATLPFLTQMSNLHPEWFTQEMLANMVAIAESTPGPLGVNMATYVGYTVAGIPGAILATLSLVLPSVIVILIIYKFLNKYNENKLVNDAFSTLRPAVTGLIAAAGYSVLKMAVLIPGSTGGFWTMLNWKAVALFAVIFAATQIKYIKKLHPIVFIGAGAVAGILFSI